MAAILDTGETVLVAGLVLTTYTARRATSTVVHNIIGRSSPIAVIGTTAARSGVLTFRGTLAQAENLVVATLGAVVVLSAPEHPRLDGMPFVIEEQGIAYQQFERGAAGWWWDIDVSYAEVAGS